MKKRNRIREHKTKCSGCDRVWEAQTIMDQFMRQNKESLNIMCFCGTRSRAIWNVNGWVVMRKYIMRKDRVKRVRK